jgi:hypothetical protein
MGHTTLRRFRRLTSSLFSRSTDGRNTAAHNSYNSSSIEKLELEASIVNLDTAGCYSGSQTGRTDHAQNAWTEPSSHIVSDLPDRTESLGDMASSAVAGSYYRPVSASILGDFEQQTERDVQGMTLLGSLQTTPSYVLPEERAQSQTRLVFRYQQTNPAILGGYGDDTAQARPGQNPDTAVNPSHPPHSHVRADRRPAASASTSVQSNNPYANLIEARQNAMTTKFLRDQEHLAQEGLPRFPGDDFG